MTKPGNNLMVTQALVQSIFTYCPVTGNVVHATNKVKVKRGDRAGSVSKSGARYLRIWGKKYLEHRVIWLYVTGAWPTHEIDHVDHNRGNNRWENLRETTHAVNMQNKPRYTNNTSGSAGVSVDKRCGKFRAYLNIHGKPRGLGYFDTYAEAVIARVSALSCVEGYHANHGK